MANTLGDNEPQVPEQQQSEVVKSNSGLPAAAQEFQSLAGVADSPGENLADLSHFSLGSPHVCRCYYGGNDVEAIQCAV